MFKKKKERKHLCFTESQDNFQESKRIAHKLGQKCLQIIYLIRELYPDSIKNFYNSFIKGYIIKY